MDGLGTPSYTYVPEALHHVGLAEGRRAVHASMSLPVNQLGDFTFFSIAAVGEVEGIPRGLQEHVEITQRNGVDGTGFILLANKGHAFEMRTVT
jgi:hypothetical protein